MKSSRIIFFAAVLLILLGGILQAFEVPQKKLMGLTAKSESEKRTEVNEGSWPESCPQPYSLIGDPFKFGEPQNPRDLSLYGYIEDPFVFNPTEYYVYKKSMHRREVIVAFNKQIPESEYGEDSRSNFAIYAFNIWDYYWHIFEGFPFAKYTILFLDGPVTYPGAHGIGYEVEYPYQCCRPTCLGGSHPHEIFHGWNSGGNGGLNPKENIREKWIIEGFTNYYMARTCSLLPYGIRSLQELDESFAKMEALTYYLDNLKGTSDDISLIEMGYKFANTEKANHFYQKGCLVAYLLDEKLHQNGNNFDELLKYMYKKFDFGLKHYTSEDWLEGANAITGKDFTQFFNNYVFGDTPLPVDENTECEFFVNNTPWYLIADFISYVSKDGTCGGKQPCFSSIQQAINSASSGSGIKISEGTYDGQIALSDSKALVLQGGWDSNFSTQTANTTFIKAPVVTQGSLKFEMVTITPIDIQANGQQGPVFVSSNNPLSIEIALSPDDRIGDLADWWIAATTPFDPPGNWYSYVYPTGWMSGINRCVQTGVFSLKSYEVLNMKLPVGKYTFYFALDEPDGKATGPWWAIDSVDVTVK